MLLNIQGSRMTFYGKFKNGSLFTDEFVAIGTHILILRVLRQNDSRCADFYGLNLYSKTDEAEAIVDDATFEYFSSLEQKGSTRYHVNATIQQKGGQMFTMTVIIDTNTPRYPKAGNLLRLLSTC
jgi:hypothetical protein